MANKNQEMAAVYGKIQDQLNKYADKVVVSQYTPQRHSENRVEGERWKDADGKEWELKNGIAQSIVKLQDAKTPWWCPKCTLPLKTELDVKMWRRRGKCHECVLKEETVMRLEGTFDDYQDRKMLENKMGFYRDRIIELAYFLENLYAPEFQIYNEDTGAMVMVETWEVPLDQLRKDVGEELVHCNKILTEMEETYRERWGEGSKPDSGDEGEQT